MAVKNIRFAYGQQQDILLLAMDLPLFFVHYAIASKFDRNQRNRLPGRCIFCQMPIYFTGMAVNNIL